MRQSWSKWLKRGPFPLGGIGCRNVHSKGATQPGRLLRLVVASAIALAPMTAVAVVTSGAASGEPTPTPIVFGAPAVGSNGAYTDSTTYTQPPTYSVPTISDGVTGEQFTVTVTPGSAGCSINSAGTVVAYANPGNCVITATTSGDADDNSNGGNSDGKESPGNEPPAVSGTLTLTVNVGHFSQIAPTSGTVITAGSTTFTSALGVSGNAGAVTYATTVPNAHLAVGSSGQIATVGGPLAVGSYPVSGSATDAFGDTANWSYTLSVTPVTLTQVAPKSATINTVGSTTFADQLAVSGSVGALAFVTGSSSPHLTVSGSGGVMTSGGPLVVGSYTVSGTDSDSLGNTGTWTYTLTVSAATILQDSPTGGTVNTAGSNLFGDQLATSGNVGAVTFVTTTSNAHLKVSASGVVATQGGPLAVGSYTVSGTDSDSLGNTGTWTYTLTVTPATITQIDPKVGAVNTVGSTGFTNQLATSGNVGAVTFVTTTSNAHVIVSASGALTVSGGPLVVGTYSVSGTDSDSLGNVGTWGYTLTVTPATITQGAPTAGTVNTTGSSSFTSQLAVSGNVGAVTFLTTLTNAKLSVSTSGALVTVGGLLAAGPYTVSGTATDPLGDTGTWTFTLTVTALGSLIITASSETVTVGTPFIESAIVTGTAPGDLASLIKVSFTYAGSGSTSYPNSSTPPTAPGIYLVTPSNATVAISPSADTANYSYYVYATGRLVITTPLTFTASSETVAAGSPVSETVSVDGLLPGDSASVPSITYTYSGTGTTTYGPSTVVPTNPGTYSVTPSDASVVITPGEDQPIYPPPYLYVKGSLTITPVGTLIVTASSENVLEGTAYTESAALTGLSPGDSGVLSGVVFTYAGIGATTYAASSTPPTAPGGYLVTPSNATIAITPASHQGNYLTIAYSTGTIIITPAPIVIPTSPPPAPPETQTALIAPFKEGSYALTAKLKVQVLRLANVIKLKKFHLVTLQGFTDNVFTAAFNSLLVQYRANVVGAELAKDLKKLKVKGVTIVTTTGASIVLVSANNSARSRALNRRVLATLSAK